MDDANSKQADQPIADLQALVAQARAGDAEVLPALRQMLESHPEIWQQCADLGGNVLRRWIERLSQGDPLAEEALLLKVEAMKIEFGGTAPTPLESLLIDRIVVCWLQLQQADGLASQMDTCPPKMATLILRRQKHAHRQFMTAIQTLAIVRRLQPGVVGASQPESR
ncbi:MAG TPA: hypothetical protein VHY91_05995 [Pirellulales bacterium]|jgi:hypothetical protein|nr:hypothetical protein [Pirellulales bacterium]